LPTKEEILSGLKTTVIAGEEEKCADFAKSAIDVGMDAYAAIMDGCGAGMKVVSDKYEKGEMYVPEILLSAEAMYAAIDVLKPHLEAGVGGSAAEKGTVAIGVVEGDIHDIGKNLVRIMLDAAGFNIVDLGRDVPIDSFVDSIEKDGTNIIAVSTLMTTTMPNIKEVVKRLNSKGIRDKVKVMVGGAPLTQEFAEKIGADICGEDAATAPGIATDLMKKLRGS